MNTKSTKDREAAEKFTRIIENLERITDMGRNGRGPVKELSLGEIGAVCRPRYGGSISVEYFRLVRLMALREMFGAESKRLSYSAGEKIGRKLDAKNLEELADRIEGMGLAKVEASSTHDKETGRNRIIVRFMECAVCAGMPYIGEPVCQFESGLLAGALERIYRKKILVIETKCSALGDGFCQFESDLVEQQRGIKGMQEGDLSIDYSEENMQLFSTLAAHAVTTLENAIRYEHTKKMVITDHLTKTHNYGHFQSRLKEEIQRSERQGHFFALVMIDLDGFKRLNDTFGHPAGDRVLREVAQILKDNIRSIDILCRYGGDEFAIILPQTDRHEAAKVLERMRAEIEGHDFSGAAKDTVPSLHITASFGCALYPQSSRYPEQLIEHADHALYEAKRSGRNQLSFHGDKKDMQ